MIRNYLHSSKFHVVMAALFALCAPSALATGSPMVSGSYQVVSNRHLGAQSQIRMRIHLVNRGSSDVSIQRMTLWDFSHPDKDAARTCAVTLRSHASADTTQEFTIPQSEYRLWQTGLRPRFVLQMGAPGSTKSKVVVRLDRISGQEAK